MKNNIIHSLYLCRALPHAALILLQLPPPHFKKVFFRRGRRLWNPNGS